MHRLATVAWICFVLLFHPGAPLSAQLWSGAPPGEDIATLAVQFGAVVPGTTFSDGSSFEQGTGVGAALSVWPLQSMGIRLNLLRAQTAGEHGAGATSPIGYQEPTLWIYGAEASVRRILEAGSFVWFPYASVGIGGKSYRWSVDRPSIGDSFRSFNVAGGVELRPAGLSPLGLMLEARSMHSDFKAFGMNETSRDLLLTLGLTFGL